MRKRQVHWTLAAGLALFAIAAGCAKQADTGGSAANVSAAPMASSAGAGGGQPAAGNTPGGSSPETQGEAARPSASVTPPAPDRYLIRNANLVIEVADARVANDKLIFAVRVAKGYVSNLQESVGSLGERTVTMQVRVPATLFDSSMQQLSSLGKVMHKTVSAEDVTEEYVDTESTVRNLRKTEERLLAHLTRTGRLSDTLLIEKELTRVRQEIERREGRLRFLGHRVEFSTIDVTLQEAARSQPALPAESYSTGKEVAGATRSLVEFLRNVWTLTIWVGIWAVVWAPLAFIAWLSVRWYRRQSLRPRNMPPPFFPPDEPVGSPSERTGVR